MKSRTLCFAPGRITPGMVLAKAVVDHDGKTLLTQGTEFTLELVDRLIRRGVETVSVLVPASISFFAIQAVLHEKRCALQYASFAWKAPNERIRFNSLY